MNLHYMAAVTFLTWYLLMPPPTPDGNFDATAPLSEWEVFDFFDTAAKCRTLVDVMREDAIAHHLPTAAPQARANAMKCVADNDSRLKDK
jgi:hypothetical protein